LVERTRQYRQEAVKDFDNLVDLRRGKLVKPTRDKPTHDSGRILSLYLIDLLLQELHLVVQLVDVVEESIVLVLDLNELLHQRMALRLEPPLNGCTTSHVLK
jgi:hypothetical protein